MTDHWWRSPRHVWAVSTVGGGRQFYSQKRYADEAASRIGGKKRPGVARYTLSKTYSVPK